jgi:hypothetical protein
MGIRLRPTPSPPRAWLYDDLRQHFTLSEKAEWDNDSTSEIVMAKLVLAHPKYLEEITELLAFLVNLSVISQATADKVLE